VKIQAMMAMAPMLSFTFAVLAVFIIISRSC
jgi:hypothetical protein